MANERPAASNDNIPTANGAPIQSIGYRPSTAIEIYHQVWDRGRKSFSTNRLDKRYTEPDRLPSRLSREPREYRPYYPVRTFHLNLMHDNIGMGLTALAPSSVKQLRPLVVPSSRPYICPADFHRSIAISSRTAIVRQHTSAAPLPRPASTFPRRRRSSLPCAAGEAPVVHRFCRFPRARQGGRRVRSGRPTLLGHRCCSTVWFVALGPYLARHRSSYCISRISNHDPIPRSKIAINCQISNPNTPIPNSRVTGPITV